MVETTEDLVEGVEEGTEAATVAEGTEVADATATEAEADGFFAPYSASFTILMGMLVGASEKRMRDYVRYSSS